MPAKDLGTKFNCFKCGVKFYDMKRPDPVCPKCGADQRETPSLPAGKARRARAPVEPKLVDEELLDEADDDEAEEVPDEEPEDTDDDQD